MLTVERPVFHPHPQHYQQQGQFYSANLFPRTGPANSSYGSSSSSSSSSASTTPQRRHSADSLAEINSSSSSWASMEKEVRTGVAWWRAKIREVNPSVSIVQLDLFEKTLARALAAKYENHWHVEEPSRGCAYRAIVTDCGSDQTIKHALTAAKINFDFEKTPIFATLWINPGRVSVRVGKSLWDDDAETAQLYPCL